MKAPLFRLRFDAPQLKAMRADRLFDRISGKVKGRSSPRSDHANLSPRPKLFRESAPRCVSGERPQTGACIGLKDKESHRITSRGLDAKAPQRCLCGAVLAFFSARRSVHPVSP